MNIQKYEQIHILENTRDGTKKSETYFRSGPLGYIQDIGEFIKYSFSL